METEHKLWNIRRLQMEKWNIISFPPQISICVHGSWKEAQLCGMSQSLFSLQA